MMPEVRSLQTYEGLKISVHSHIEAIKFLLENGFEYVLSDSCRMF